MEATMHGTFERPGRSNDRLERRWNFWLLALPVLAVIAVIGLAIIQPAAPIWISQAVQAEIVGPFAAPDIAPTQLAQPGSMIRTIRTN
jgi:hypothetical protein